MGSLKLPASGLVYVETPVVIYTIEPHPIYAPLLRPLWQAAQARNLQVITSGLTLLETLVHSFRNQDRSLQAAYERLLLSTPEVEMQPITPDVLREAARLRAATPGLRAPDAIHAATALLSGCALFLINDPGFRRVSGLPLAILDDAVVS